jgi:light-regulated signal transduction histidine kinase (bacteriophytochrome)
MTSNLADRSWGPNYEVNGIEVFNRGKLNQDATVVNCLGELRKHFLSSSKYSSARSSQPMENGTGLVRSLARRIVEQHQGHIEVRSVVEKGSKVLLPFQLPFPEIASST